MCMENKMKRRTNEIALILLEALHFRLQSTFSDYVLIFF